MCMIAMYLYFFLFLTTLPPSLPLFVSSLFQVNLHFALSSLLNRLTTEKPHLPKENPLLASLMGMTDEYLVTMGTAVQVMQYLLCASSSSSSSSSSSGGEMETDSASTSEGAGAIQGEQCFIKTIHYFVCLCLIICKFKNFYYTMTPVILILHDFVVGLGVVIFFFLSFRSNGW